MHFEFKPFLFVQSFTMTVSPTDTVPTSTKKEHYISLTETGEEPLPDDRKVTHSLRSNPSAADSPKYKTSMYLLHGDESVTQIVKWYTDAKRVLAGLNITTYRPSVQMYRTLMHGTCVDVFDSKLQEFQELRKQELVASASDATAKAAALRVPLDHASHCSIADVDDALNHLVDRYMPRRILVKVKRHLRREMRKPRDMGVRRYYQNLLRINYQIIPKLPPFGTNQSIGKDELLDVLLFGTPKSWQKEMERQGFDPMDKPLKDVVDFMERIEATEDHDNSPQTKKVSTKNGKDKRKDKRKTSSSGGTKSCLIHGEGSHDSSECYVLQKEAKRLKAEHKPSGNKGGNTWSERAKKNQSKAKSDLAAFAKRSGLKPVKAKDATKSEDKKRKPDAQEDSDSDLNAFDLKDFNYSDMDNLKIDSDDEFSV